ncbi:hypothetical protein [Salinarimonas soli]|uniref:Uncharacterized protein n=1 Tax=Salinarimonas soli TaxID=1638099 RepID=A0A5B2VDE4_9HYPH|nr:hypothetical protein [Salinarimonas soli]KAA2236432.1 hypothetical protein F0L46_14920 [Salinarimonas soli]
MYDEPFFAVRLKLQRAGEHIDTLEREVAEYVARGVDLRTVETGEAWSVTWRMEILEAPPVHWPSIIGDAIHNLRASLDLLVTEAIAIKEGVDSATLEKVSFPVAKDVIKLQDTLAGSGALRVGNAVVIEIAKFQPFTLNGNELITAIHELDILDKHRALVPSAGTFRGASSESGFGSLRGIMPGDYATFGSHADAPSVQGIPPGVGDIGIPVSFTLHFPRTPKFMQPGDLALPFSGRSVIETLREVLTEYRRLVDAVEAVVPSRQ